MGFALAYFNQEGLPDKLSNIPLEYFEKAIGYLQSLDEVEKDRIGVLGASRGENYPCFLVLHTRKSNALSHMLEVELCGMQWIRVAIHGRMEECLYLIPWLMPIPNPVPGFGKILLPVFRHDGHLFEEYNGAGVGKWKRCNHSGRTY